jgi:hypothetical protein
MDEENEKPAAAIEALGLTVETVFVPAAKDTPDADLRLNWRARVLRNGRLVLETDYSQGVAHCPSYKAKGLGVQNSVMRWKAIRQECETGKTSGAYFPGKPIARPTAADILYCLVRDADAIDHAIYETWASEYGYDEDSRKGEAIYRACLEIGLKLRAAIGDAGLSRLQTAFQDY